MMGPFFILKKYRGTGHKVKDDPLDCKWAAINQPDLKLKKKKVLIL